MRIHTRTWLGQPSIVPKSLPRNIPEPTAKHSLGSVGTEELHARPLAAHNPFYVTPSHAMIRLDF